MHKILPSNKCQVIFMVTVVVISLQDEGGNPDDMEVNMDVEMELDEPEPPAIPPPPPPPPSKEAGVVSVDVD